MASILLHRGRGLNQVRIGRGRGCGGHEYMIDRSVVPPGRRSAYGTYSAWTCGQNSSADVAQSSTRHGLVLIRLAIPGWAMACRPYATEPITSPSTVASDLREHG